MYKVLERRIKYEGENMNVLMAELIWIDHWIVKWLV